jgi:hypothetical protein
MWGELANDASGILLFLAWLALPPLYAVVLGRRYIRRCADAAQKAVWANEELRQALEDVEDLLASQQRDQDSTHDESPSVPPAREYRRDDTQELAPLADDSDRHRRHRLDMSRLANANANA